MSRQAELQVLLRFLSQDAKVPLATAMSKIKILQNDNLTRYLVLLWPLILCGLQCMGYRGVRLSFPDAIANVTW